MKKVILMLITTIALPFVSLAQGVNGTSYPGNNITYYGSGSSTTSVGSTHFGDGANSGGTNNTVIGADAGTFSSGNNNTYLGYYSSDSAYGNYNVHLGSYSGNSATGSGNVFLGYESGDYSYGNSNLYLGDGSGSGANGDNNIFIGKNTGTNLSVDNRLYIDNSSTATPLIYGEFDNNILTVNGRLGIGTKVFDGYELGVKGKVAAEEVLVKVYPWPDFVFNKDYNLPTLKEVESYIKEKGHLQNIPSANDVEENGILLGDMNAKLLQKIEELTLYTIKQEKELESQQITIEQQQKEFEQQQQQNSSLEDRLKKIEQLLSNK